MEVILISRKWNKKSAWRKKRKKQKLLLREKISGTLELPEEILLDIPRIHMTGSKKLLVENYKGVLEYTSEKVRLDTSRNILVITGTDLDIREVTLEDIFIEGNIRSLDFK
jgi:sporulation protein YqfC